jgi:hypothetical protein
MAIDPKVAESTRKMLGQAIRCELDTLAVTIQAAGNETFLAALDLVTFAAGYIAIDVTGMRWPSEVALRQIAEAAAKTAAQLPVTDEMLYQFLSRVALGPERLSDVFTDEAADVIPFFVTANLLLRFRPGDKEWAEYLAQICNAVVVADHVQDWVVPALMLRVRKDAMRARAR